MLKALAMLLALTVPALGQQQPPTPREIAIGQKLLEEINANIALRVQLLQLEDQLKAKPPPDPPKEPPQPPSK